MPELGAGGGQFAVTSAPHHHQVTALELSEAGSAHTRWPVSEHGVGVETLGSDFYRLDPGGPYGAVCC